MNIIIVVIVVLITTSLIIPSHSWDIGHGGISPYLNRKTTDHDDQANRPMTPSELLKEENVVTSQFPWFKTKKIALETLNTNKNVSYILVNDGTPTEQMIENIEEETERANHIAKSVNRGEL